MEKQSLINKHFGAILTGIITLAVACSSVFISIRQIKISTLESQKRMNLDSLQYRKDSIRSNQEYELELAQFILQTRDSLFDNPQNAYYTIEILKWTFSKNEFVSEVLDSIYTKIDLNEKQNTEIVASNNVNIPSPDRGDEGWIYIGEFVENSYSQTNKVDIPDILPQKGKVYETITNLYLREGAPKGLLYKKADQLGVIKTGKKVKIIDVKSVGWKGTHVWAEVEVL